VVDEAEMFVGLAPPKTAVDGDESRKSCCCA
jgi:hypothetical protein